MAMFPDFALADISNLFTSYPLDEDAEPSLSTDTGEPMIVFAAIS